MEVYFAATNINKINEEEMVFAYAAAIFLIIVVSAIFLGR